MRSFPFTTFLVALFLSSCTDGLKLNGLLSSDKFDSVSFTNSISPLVKSPIPCIIGEQLTNPYKLEIMQLACDSLCAIQNLPPRVITSNQVYVRFLPQDSTEYLAVKSIGVDLFDYPLDYEIYEGGANYHDPSLADDQMTWQYCSVPVNTIFPNVFYEVLDSCYVPQPSGGLELENLENPTSTKSGLNGAFDFERALEKLACQIANPSLEGPNANIGNQLNSINPAYPSGYIRLWNDQNESLPVKKIKVTARYFIKSCTVFTDENGYYTMNKQFSQSPTYSIQMANQIGFEIFDSPLALTPYSYVFGEFSNLGYTALITQSNPAWTAACVNYCTYDFFQRCINENRPTPHNDLRINIKSYLATQGSGAPMLKHLGYQNISGYSVNEIWTAFMHELGTIPTTLFLPLLRYLLLPDIVILSNSSFSQIATTVYHELSHAVHYKTSGQSVWIPLIYDTLRNSIPNDNGYGDGTLNDNAQNITELAESWAFANERLFQYQNGWNPNAGYGWWFSDTIDAFYELITKGILTTTQVSYCLSPTVYSVEDLYSRLCISYPGKKEKITAIFADHHALAYQSVWKIKNSTSNDVYMYNLTYFGSETFSNNSTAIVAATPYSVSDYPTLRTENSSFYPYLIILTNSNGLFYRRQENVTYTPLIGKDPFVASDWTVTTTSSNVGNWTKKEFVFNLVPSDYE